MKRTRIAHAIIRRVADAVLRQLYDVRGVLTRKRRLGEITTEQVAALRDLERWIDWWEAYEQAPKCDKPMLEDLYSQLGQIGVKVGARFIVPRSPWRCGLPSWHKGECGAPYARSDDEQREGMIN